ncbi:unnamed protein product [Symbiodinium natans]|uniref:Uncharacterized protein n=1 Tax=Symbiodinium natans TaxID=878477 RepID=A0A812JH74_9DINO|nr:unnamed protein product [Symbiodinium natans]
MPGNGAYDYADWDGWGAGWDEDWEEGWRADAWWNQEEPRPAHSRRVLPSAPAWVSQSSSDRLAGKGLSKDRIKMPPGLDVSNGLAHSIRASRPEKGKDGKDGKEGKEGKAFAITMKGKKGPPQRALGKGQESYSTQKGTWERGQEKGRKQSKDKGGRRPKGGWWW